jgi:hypothetical protein
MMHLLESGNIFLSTGELKTGLGNSNMFKFWMVLNGTTPLAKI